jgi:hypothetical protein
MTRLISLFKDAHNGTRLSPPQPHWEMLRDQPAYFVELMRYLQERRELKDDSHEETALIGE